jgi:hypothetical protein
MNDLFRSMVSRLSEAARSMAQEFGPFHFFGLLHRDNALYDQWDLIAAAPWLHDSDTDEGHDSLKLIIDRLRPFLAPEDWILILPIVTFAVGSEELDQLIRAVDGRTGFVEGPFRVGLQRIEQAYVIVPGPPKPAGRGKRARGTRAK